VRDARSGVSSCEMAAGRTMVRRLASGAAAPSAVRLNFKDVPAQTRTSEPPLLILHGLFGSSSNFRSIATKLSSSRRVILPDLRNHGASEWADDASLGAMANDVIALCDELGLSEVSLCGHSLGGKVAMLTALVHAERVSRLCVVDIAPVEYTMAGNRNILEVMAALPAQSLASRKVADAALLSAAASAHDDNDALKSPFVRQFLLQSLIPEECKWRINVLALLEGYNSLRGFPAPQDSSSLVPTLFIGGERGGMLEHSHWGSCTTFFPEARLEMMPTSHFVHAEKPEEFTQLVGPFFSRE